MRCGEVAWQSDSWAAVVSDQFVTSVCAWCFHVPSDEAGSMTIQCSECGIAYYCSEKCREQAKPVHAHECKPAWQIVQMTQGKSDTRGARMLVRVLAQRKLELEAKNAGGDAPAEPEPETAEDGRGSGSGSGGGGGGGKPQVWRGAKYADVERLVSHVDIMSDEKVQAFRAIAKGIGRMPIAQGVGEEQLIDLIATLQCNSQAVVDLNHHKRGDLLLAPADPNHSCNPNTFVAFYGRTVQFRCIREVAKGEEITITYTDLYLPRPVRRAKLLTSHCFECSCARCEDGGSESIDAKLSGFRCKSAGCDGVVSQPTAEDPAGIPGTCSRCEAHYDPQVLKATAAAAAAAFDAAAAIYKERKFDAARNAFENFMAAYGDSELHPGHTLVYNALHQLMSVCNATGDAEVGSEYCRRAITCLKTVYPPYHSEVAMMHAALAQTEWRRYTDTKDRQAQAATVAAFDDCVKVLEVCYGEGHEAHKELSKLRAASATGAYRVMPQ
eukprot:COSAG05_NODE_1320_length_5193_cov_4.563997_2_plen_497_part_00